MDDYSDIINHPHHVSKRRPQMPMSERAAQFSPFAALTGYGDVIQEAGRFVGEKTLLDEETLKLLDLKFQMLADHMDEKPVVTFTVFVPDEAKAGGAYTDIVGVIKKVDTFQRMITLDNGMQIPMDNIIHMESEIFRQKELD